MKEKSEASISQEEIIHIAKLARLQLTAEEIVTYSKQLSKAIGYFEQISEVPTEGIEPLVTPTDIEYVLRPDEVIRSVGSEEILANAPHKTGHLFTVPPVV